MRIHPLKKFPERECPGCATPCPANENRCPICGYEFPQSGRFRLGWKGIAVLVLIALLALWFGIGCSRPVPEPALPHPARRVISLAPNLTEIVFALGAGNRLVGRSSACDQPAEAARIPVIGDFGRPSMERILAAAPDLVLDTDLEDEPMGRAIERAGIARRQIRCRTLDDIPAAIREVGRLLDESTTAESLAARLEQELAVRRARLPDPNAPRVYAEIWPDPPMTAGRRSFVSELITLAGGNPVGDVADREYYTVSSETVLVWNPDILLALYAADPAVVVGQFSARPGWDSLPAVRSGRILIPPDLNILLRPGPRIIEGLEWLEKSFRKAEPGVAR